MRLASIMALAFAVLGASFGAACHRPGATAATDEAGAGEPAPLTLREDSTDLLLTWIDAKGDFHVEQSVADVPMVGRDAVRVIDPMREDGTHPDHIFVADLRVARQDGSYPVRVTTRAEFDKMAEARRAKDGLTLAGGQAKLVDAGTAPSSLPELAGGSGAPDPSGAARPTVIIYGASWCGPCHQAADYLRKKGVAYVMKDIEEDTNAGREMRAKLAKAGMQTGSIPVIDVRGKLLVGFSAESVDEALGQAL